VLDHDDPNVILHAASLKSLVRDGWTPGLRL
jgi:hypothetical protein